MMSFAQDQNQPMPPLDPYVYGDASANMSLDQANAMPSEDYGYHQYNGYDPGHAFPFDHSSQAPMHCSDIVAQRILVTGVLDSSSEPNSSMTPPPTEFYAAERPLPTYNELTSTPHHTSHELINSHSNHEQW